MFKYYEDGTDKTITFRKAYRMFTVMVDDNQKAQGTTFTSWLSEMEKLQILIRISQNNYSIREVLIMAWIQEKTKEEVENLRDKLLQSGKIKSTGKVEKYIHHRDRKTHEPIYYYQCECK